MGSVVGEQPPPTVEAAAPEVRRRRGSDPASAGDRKVLEATIAFALLGSGLAVGLPVGFDKHSIPWGLLSGVGTAVVTAFLIWVLFGPLKGLTQFALRPLVDAVSTLVSTLRLR